MASSDGKLGPILPSDALTAITGLSASRTSFNPDADKIFQMAQTAASKNTPMVFQTMGDAKTLVGTHAYGMFDGTGSGDDRMCVPFHTISGNNELTSPFRITLFNPWGSVASYKLDDIVADCYLLWYLTNYDSFGGGGGGDPTPKTSKEQSLSPTFSGQGHHPHPTSAPPVVQNDIAQNSGTWTTWTSGNVVVEEEIVTVTVQG